MTNELLINNFFKKAIELLQLAQKQVVYSVNQTMVQSYFLIGKMIIEEEQHVR